jgi:hypothetical protein
VQYGSCVVYDLGKRLKVINIFSSNITPVIETVTYLKTEANLGTTRSLFGLYFYAPIRVLFSKDPFLSEKASLVLSFLWNFGGTASRFPGVEGRETIVNSFSTVEYFILHSAKDDVLQVFRLVQNRLIFYVFSLFRLYCALPPKQLLLLTPKHFCLF